MERETGRETNIYKHAHAHKDSLACLKSFFCENISRFFFPSDQKERVCIQRNKTFGKVDRIIQSNFTVEKKVLFNHESNRPFDQLLLVEWIFFASTLLLLYVEVHKITDKCGDIFLNGIIMSSLYVSLLIFDTTRMVISPCVLSSFLMALLHCLCPCGGSGLCWDFYKAPWWIRIGGINPKRNPCTKDRVKKKTEKKRKCHFSNETFSDDESERASEGTKQCKMRRRSCTN